jgi:hypothetical protein
MKPHRPKPKPRKTRRCAPEADAAAFFAPPPDVENPDWLVGAD